MTAIEYTARIKDDDDEITAEATVSYDFGDNLPESIELFGEEVVYKRFVAAATVDLQGLIRRSITGGKDREALSGEALQDAVNEWKPGVAKARKSKTEKALAIVSGMSKEEKLALLAELAGEDDEAEEAA